MKKIIIALIITCSTLTSFAADSLFKKGEVGASVFATYTDVDKPVGAGVSASFFPANKYLGAEVSTLWASGGSVFDNVGFQGILRYPFEKYNFAPYLIGGISYNFDAKGDSLIFDRQTWTAGVGAEYRFHRNFGVFGDYQYLLDSELNQGRVGITFRF